MAKMRNKTFDRVEHVTWGLFPISIETIHTRKGQGSWRLSLRAAKKLHKNLGQAIEREEKREARAPEITGEKGKEA